VEAFLAEFNEKYDRHVKAVDDTAMLRLREHAWPGNVRELRNIIERAVVSCRDDLITTKSLRSLRRRPGARPDGWCALASRHDARAGRARADLEDLGIGQQQQDAGGRDPRHHPEDTSQQDPEVAERGETRPEVAERGEPVRTLTEPGRDDAARLERYTRHPSS